MMSLHWDFLTIECVILLHVLYGRRMLRNDDLLGDRTPVSNQPQFVLDWRGDGWADRLFQSLVDELQMIVCPAAVGCRADLNASTGCAGSETP